MQDPDWHAPLLEPRTRAVHRRAIVRRIALLCIPTVVLAVQLFPEGLLSLALAAGAGYAWGSVADRRAGHATTGAITVFAGGAVLHRVHVVPRRRVQSARTTASPFQRHAGLATCWLDIAGSPAAHLYDIDAATAADMRTDMPRG